MGCLDYGPPGVHILDMWVQTAQKAISWSECKSINTGFLNWKEVARRTCCSRLQVSCSHTSKQYFTRHTAKCHCWRLGALEHGIGQEGLGLARMVGWVFSMHSSSAISLAEGFGSMLYMAWHWCRVFPSWPPSALSRLYYISSRYNILETKINLNYI